MTVRLAKLGEVCDINPRLGRKHGLSEDTPVSFVPMAAVSELTASVEAPQTRTFRDVKKGYTTFADGDVLFAKITPCMENGKAALARNLVGGIGFGSTEFHVLRARENVLPEWIHFFVRQDSFRADAKRNFTGTAGQQRVPTTFLAAADIPVPGLAEQRRIVGLLTRAEGIVRLRREAQRKAAELIPAIFVDMFGDPATNPKGWPKKRLGELVTCASGGTPSKARADFWVGDLPWVSPKDMKRDVLTSAIDTVSRKVLEETSLKKLSPGCVLIVVRGMILVHSVPVAITAVPVIINQDMKALQSHGELGATYLLWMLKVSHAKLLDMVSTAAHGTKKLETKDLLGLDVPVPSGELQQEFEQRALAATRILERQDAALATAQATFNALLAQAFAPAMLQSHAPSAA